MNIKKKNIFFFLGGWGGSGWKGVGLGVGLEGGRVGGGQGGCELRSEAFVNIKKKHFFFGGGGGGRVGGGGGGGVGSGWKGVGLAGGGGGGVRVDVNGEVKLL